ncbi:hypothetical protein OG948_00765 [Embleya sp. NBC_00888]|uniref:hypothetical protein n=1 Tax=Embleya sp. NBC_00888 TaxID=2975960 RepID=UPI003862D404|nr:hypothetical protein OG948_00765 [Embleya sp. NBC_00888]
MSRYTVAYGPEAATRDAMPADLRRRFEIGMAKLAGDPYANGSTPIGGERDRRDATVAACLVVYYVAAECLRITTVRIRPPY